jgi:alkaline phosphatase
MDEQEQGHLSRRDALKSAAAGVLGAGVLAGSAVAQPNRRAGRGRAGRAKNVIFLVVDGMSQGTWTMADMAARKRGERSEWVRLYERGAPITQCLTHSANSHVTDSAAAGCAWGAGQHINNRAINVHGGRELEPIFVTAKRAGLSTGLVTTTRVTHATPASFVANAPHRNMEGLIGEQIINRGVDVVLGGGSTFFDLEALGRDGRYAVATDASELRSSAQNGERLIGLFTPGHMDYELDRPETQPHLREMSMTAIERLSRAPGGFILQIEAGRVDHAGHSNDAPGILFDQIAFEQTISDVMSWADGRDDTLVIITTDHGCAGPDLTLYGDTGNHGFDRLLECRRTMTWAIRRAASEGGPRERARAAATAVRQEMSVELRDDDIEWLARAFAGERVDGFDSANSAGAALSAVLANHFGVAFISGNHTAEMVHATAVGPGSERMRPMMDNIELYDVAMAALGLS